MTTAKIESMIVTAPRDMVVLTMTKEEALALRLVLGDSNHMTTTSAGLWDVFTALRDVVQDAAHHSRKYVIVPVSYGG